MTTAKHSRHKQYAGKCWPVQLTEQQNSPRRIPHPSQSWWCFCLSSPPSDRVCALWVVPVDAKVFHVSKKRLNLPSINLLLWALYLVIMIKSSPGWRDGPPTNTRSWSLLILWLKLETRSSSGGSKSYGKVNTQAVSLVNKKALIGHISGGRWVGINV